MLLAAALATGQPGPVLAATPVLDATPAAIGTKTSAAELTVQFTDTGGKILATAVIGPAGKQAKPVLDYQQAAGPVPAGVTRVRVTITLTITLTDWNGPDAPQTGYNYATAADISLTLNQPPPAPVPLTPTAADVPGYQHVFLFYFENEDYSQVISNTKQAPYLNSLRGRGATLINFYAEEHPSDANYLALAGGSAFGVPLTDPAR